MAAYNSCMKNLMTNQQLRWFLLLLPVALFMPALTIDEMRYLSIAWEMRTSGDVLMPHLNGVLYSDKGPSLFWLVNIACLVAGPHVWIVRLGLLVVSLSSLVLFERLVCRLDPADAQAGGTLSARATIILSGIVYFAIFASAIMFDALLTTCVLVALHGVLDLDGRRWARGILVVALGLSLGLLTKGPAVLLDACMVAVFAPWWSETARTNVLRWYVSIVLGVVGGIAIALIWALVAYGGFDAFWNAVVVRQTIGRISTSFAHARPIWWYLVVLPFMVLPWTLSLRAPWQAWRDGFFADKPARFAVVWFLPAFLVFCKFSGKQPHYLLPLLPGLALYFAHVLRYEAARVRGRLFGLLLLLVGVLLAATPYLADHAATLPWLDKLVDDGSFSGTQQKVIGGVWPLWGMLIAAIGIFCLRIRVRKCSCTRSR
jgi:4-amino-4-deoxy-L-arabinose transferase-like glycosyltransferase